MMCAVMIESIPARIAACEGRGVELAPTAPSVCSMTGKP